MPNKDNSNPNVEKVEKFLEENGLNVVSQMSIVLESGEVVPIRGFISQPLVVETKKEEDGPVEQTDPDSGEGKK